MSMRREKRKRLAVIENQLSELEETVDPSPALQPYKISLNQNTNIILNDDQVQDQVLKLRQKHFELGDMPHKLLSRRLRGLQDSRTICKIRSNLGN